MLIGIGSSIFFFGIFEGLGTKIKLRIKNPLAKSILVHSMSLIKEDDNKFLKWN